MKTTIKKAREYSGPAAGQICFNDSGRRCVLDKIVRTCGPEGDYRFLEYSIDGRGSGHTCSTMTWRNWWNGQTWAGDRRYPENFGGGE